MCPTAGKDFAPRHPTREIDLTPWSRERSPADRQIPPDEGEGMAWGHSKRGRAGTALDADGRDRRAEEPKGGDRGGAEQRIRWSRHGIEPDVVAQPQIIRGTDVDGPRDVQLGGGPQNHPSGIDQIQIRGPEIGRLQCPEDVRGVAAGDPTENIRGRKTSLVEKVGDVVCRDTELPETVKE